MSLPKVKESLAHEIYEVSQRENVKAAEKWSTQRKKTTISSLSIHPYQTDTIRNQVQCYIDQNTTSSISRLVRWWLHAIIQSFINGPH